MEKWYKMAEGYNKRYPNGVEPYQILARVLEECGEVAAEVALWENSGIKRQKHGEPSKQKLADEIRQAMTALSQLVVYYQVQDELDQSVNASLNRMKDEGLFDV